MSTTTTEQRRQQMAIAAMSAIDDYTNDIELLAFTALDREDFYDELDNGRKYLNYASDPMDAQISSGQTTTLQPSLSSSIVWRRLSVLAHSAIDKILRGL